MNLSNHSHLRIIAAQCCGICSVLIGLGTIAGYLFDIPEMATWGEKTLMSFPSGTAFFLQGIGIYLIGASLRRECIRQ
jgi:hypothetical protein